MGGFTRSALPGLGCRRAIIWISSEDIAAEGGWRVLVSSRRRFCWEEITKRFESADDILSRGGFVLR